VTCASGTYWLAAPRDVGDNGPGIAGSPFAHELQQGKGGGR